MSDGTDVQEENKLLNGTTLKLQIKITHVECKILHYTYSKMYTKPNWQVTESKVHGRREGRGDKSICGTQRAHHVNIMTCKIYLKLDRHLQDILPSLHTSCICMYIFGMLKKTHAFYSHQEKEDCLQSRQIVTMWHHIQLSSVSSIQYLNYFLPLVY